MAAVAENVPGNAAPSLGSPPAVLPNGRSRPVPQHSVSGDGNLPGGPQVLRSAGSVPVDILAASRHWRLARWRYFCAAVFLPGDLGVLRFCVPPGLWLAANWRR